MCLFSIRLSFVFRFKCGRLDHCIKMAIPEDAIALPTIDHQASLTKTIRK